MGVFHGYQIALELSSFMPLKKKQELRKLITSNDGIISFIVTKKCKLLVTLHDEEKAKDSFKCQTALRYNIPVVESRYLYDCIQTGQLVDPDPYVLLGSTKNQLLNAGVIAAPQGKAGSGKMKKKLVLFNLNGIKVWTQSDKNAPFFPDDSYEIAKSIQLTNPEKKLFFVAEVHVATVSSDFKFRIFTHSGEIPTQTTDPDVEIGKKEFRYSNSADECLAIYSRMYQLQVDVSNGFTKTREYLGRNIGSKRFQQNQLELMVNTHGPEKEVGDLVELIWKEAMGELEDVLSISIDNITVEQVEKAESVLLELRRLLDEKMDSDAKKTKLDKLSDEFYSHLAHSPTHRVPINSKHIISKKQELCQVIRDMVSVSEGTGWSRRCPTEAKYRSLRCHMVSLKETSPEYERIKNLVISSQKGKLTVGVESIFEVSRSVEDRAFASKLENKQLLFHSSRVHNFVGILSRGLLLPKVVVDDFGGTRTDAGMLGSGVYFADDASTSAKYSQPSKCKGTRLMLVSEVALGQCLELFEHNTELHGAPEGYNSVHGVKASSDIKSQFKDDEYAIYNTNQQRLRYLVEFRMEADVVKAPVKQQMEDTIESLPAFKPTGKISAETVELDDIQNILDPLLNVKAGLVSDSNAPVPLTAVHVKARLIDLAAQVIVLQHYKSEYNAPIEAKYVFPLDEMAAVCGFEAFINDKHIVGEVKEKETAHREYKEAISQGHGAYLMDQDVETPDVFTVSVGNLPPFCSVLIKITYVAELQMEGEKVSFRIPACVAPWKKSAGLGEVTQGDLDTVKVTEDQIETSVQVAIEMPFEIKKIDCPTHRIRLKKTETKAVVEMRKNQPIDEGFQLLISLAEIHVPRMWVEELPDNPDSRACMLTFYPEFEASVSESFEVIFLLDLSNSMKGSSLTEAKKILLLALHLLPESCYFNVIIFGTDYDELFPCSRTKTPANTKLAEKFIKSQEAVMGNTEVIRPLSSLFLVCPEDSIQNLFLVSDGHISNEQTTLDAIRTNSGRSRIFTFGVGSVANQHTLRSLARAGCGYYEFFNSKMKSRWETKIRNQLAKAAQPSLSSICVEWRNFNDAGPPVQAPAEIMALFNGCRQVVYGFVPDCTQATLKAVIDNQEVSTMVSTAELNITTGKILHQLTARAVIQDWNDGQLAAERLEHEILKKNRKNYIIKLSMEFSIITQFTSFVAIEKREKDEVMTATQDLNELVEKDSVDILDYMGWEDVKCRVNIKTFNHPTFTLDLDLNDTVLSVRDKICDVTSEFRFLTLSLFDEPASDGSILWDQKIEYGATVYGIMDEYEMKAALTSGGGDVSQYEKLLIQYDYLRDQRGKSLSAEAIEKVLEEIYSRIQVYHPTHERGGLGSSSGGIRRHRRDISEEGCWEAERTKSAATDEFCLSYSDEDVGAVRVRVASASNEVVLDSDLFEECMVFRSLNEKEQACDDESEEEDEDMGFGTFDREDYSPLSRVFATSHSLISESEELSSAVMTFSKKTACNDDKEEDEDRGFGLFNGSSDESSLSREAGSLQSLILESEELSSAARTFSKKTTESAAIYEGARFHSAALSAYESPHRVSMEGAIDDGASFDLSAVSSSYRPLSNVEGAGPPLDRKIELERALKNTQWGGEKREESAGPAFDRVSFGDRKAELERKKSKLEEIRSIRKEKQEGKRFEESFSRQSVEVPESHVAELDELYASAFLAGIELTSKGPSESHENMDRSELETSLAVRDSDLGSAASPLEDADTLRSKERFARKTVGGIAMCLSGDSLEPDYDLFSSSKQKKKPSRFNEVIEESAAAPPVIPYRSAKMLSLEDADVKQYDVLGMKKRGASTKQTARISSEVPVVQDDTVELHADHFVSGMELCSMGSDSHEDMAISELDTFGVGDSARDKPGLMGSRATPFDAPMTQQATPLHRSVLQADSRQNFAVLQCLGKSLTASEPQRPPSSTFNSDLFGSTADNGGFSFGSVSVGVSPKGRFGGLSLDAGGLRQQQPVNVTPAFGFAAPTQFRGFGTGAPPPPPPPPPPPAPAGAAPAFQSSGFGTGASFADAAPAPQFGGQQCIADPPSFAASVHGFGADAPMVGSAQAFRSSGFGTGASFADAAPAFQSSGFYSGASFADAAPAFGSSGFGGGGTRMAGAARTLGFGAPLVGGTSGFGTLSADVSSTSRGVSSLFGAPSSGGQFFAKLDSAPVPSDGLFGTPSAVVTSSYDGPSASVFSELKLAAVAPPTVPAPPPVPGLFPATDLAPVASSAPEGQQLFFKKTRMARASSDIRQLGEVESPFWDVCSGASSRGDVLPPEPIQTGGPPPPPPPPAAHSSQVDLPPLPPPLPSMAMAKRLPFDESAHISSRSPAYMPSSQKYRNESLRSSAISGSLMRATPQSFKCGKQVAPKARPPLEVGTAEEVIEVPMIDTLAEKLHLRRSQAKRTGQLLCFSQPSARELLPQQSGVPSPQESGLPPPEESVAVKEIAPPLPPKSGGRLRQVSLDQSPLRRRSSKRSSVTGSQLLVPIRLSIGIETLGRVMTPIFKYNMPLPVTVTKFLTTCADYQTRVLIKVYEGEYPLTKYNHLLGQMELTGILPRIRGRAKIKATFNIDVQGSLSVEAVDEATGEFRTLTVTINEEEKSQEEIDRMIKDAEEMENREPLETADDIQENSDGNWDICIYDESNDGTVPDFREDLFNSTVQMNISTGQVSWTESALEKLITLYTEQAETAEGYWELNFELGELLCIDVKKCKKMLVENGLNSLGIQANLDVSRLIATFLVLFRVFESQAQEDAFSLDAVHFKEHLDSIIAGDEFESIPDTICTPLTRSARFCRKIDVKHPLLYSRLNLGRSWPEAAINLLGKNAGSCLA